MIDEKIFYISNIPTTLKYFRICCHPLLSFQKERTDSPQLQQVKDKVSMKNNGAFARNNLIPITVLKIIIVVVLLL